MVAEYLDKNYDRVRPSFPLHHRIITDMPRQFFSSFTTLILSNNYVTKRQSLKLLGEILLDRANFNVMTRYIANEANLKMMMNLLRDKSKNIQFEAFHVFKVCQVAYDECIADIRSGVCGKPEETPSDRVNFAEEQGQAPGVP